MLSDRRRFFFILTEQSHLFIAFCASLLAVQSFILTKHDIVWTAVALTFFATLAVYNLSVIALSVSQEADERKMKLNFEGNRLNLFLFSGSSVAVLLLLPGCSHFQAMIFVAVSLLALLYMMPLKLNQNRIPGFRHHWLVKNILLSFIWSVATVLIPLSGDAEVVFETELMFVLIRNFFFIYALTVIYDLRDLRQDAEAGMKTLAMAAGVSGARVIALLSLTVFALLAFADPVLETGYRVPLVMSFLVAAVVVALAGPARKRSYFLWAVDGMMALKALLVILIH